MEQPDKGTVRDLVCYRLETAKNDLRTTCMLMRENEYRTANNRAYYAIFHAISAIHAIDGKVYKRHKDSLANFNKDYIRTEIFPKAFGRKIIDAEEIRHASDYDDFYIATKAEAEEQITTAKELIGLIEGYCLSRMEVD
ncbi:MAG: HEPN domain-containing protein [Lachnospiraceae bacterium]|nr:HEPN domain-containing protein [Lachnospiraceae bacterium]